MIDYDKMTKMTDRELTAYRDMQNAEARLLDLAVEYYSKSNQNDDRDVAIQASVNISSEREKAQIALDNRK